MTKEALITNVSCNLQKQAGIAYAIGIENVRIPFYPVSYTHLSSETM